MSRRDLTTKILRPYQVDAIRDTVATLLGDSTAAGLQQPTSAGKSIEMLCIAASWPGRVVVAVPLLGIKNNFLRGDSLRFMAPPSRFPSVPGSVRAGLFFDLTGLVASRGLDSVSSSTAELAAHLAPTARPPSRIFVTTHQTLCRLLAQLPERLDGMLFLIDEAHHAGVDADGGVTLLGQLVLELRARGAKVLLISATPYRTDGARVFPEGIPVHALSMSEYAAMGYAPRDLKIRAVLSQAFAKTQDQWTGETGLSRKQARTLAREIVRKYIADSRSVREPGYMDMWLKALMNVPSRRSAKMRDALLEAFKELAPEVRVFDAVGPGRQKQLELEALLQHERTVSRYEDSKVDVIIACQRFNEGVDWPLCCEVYAIGIPGSLTRIIQWLGRALRLKGSIVVAEDGTEVFVPCPGYPPGAVQRARITFFGLSVRPELHAKYARAHHEAALLLACLLDSAPVGLLFGRAFRMQSELARRQGEIPARRKVWDERLLAEAMRLLVVAQTAVGEEANAGELGEYLHANQERLVRQLPPDLDFDQLLLAVRGLVFARGARKANATRRANVAAGEMLDVLTPVLCTNFREAMRGLEDLTIVDAVNSVVSVQSEFTGQDAREIRRRLEAAALQRSWTSEDLVARGFNVDRICMGARQYRKEHGQFPVMDGSNALRWTELPATWARLDEELRAGPWVQAGAPPLSLSTALGLTQRYPIPLDSVKVRASVEAFARKWGCLPPGSQGIDPTTLLHDTPVAKRLLRPGLQDAPRGENWILIDLALRWGFRGLPGGGSLKALLEGNLS